MKYFVTVGERSLEVEIDGDQVRVDGRVVEATLVPREGTPMVRLELDGVRSTLALDGHEGTQWRLLDRGAVRDVEVEDERSRHIRLLAGAGKATGGHRTLKAPMPGLVLRILVAVGDTVAVGSPLLALEAMKMENELKAASAGQVVAIRVTQGQAVEKGQVLLELG